ncbi:hypothetical protein [Anaeromicrobium sediminis]|uniref:Uncharacterized protein n=1 Tax=Anaeromicrobium sediminis TaxID=1478221 RepID=A0A267MGE0_9FIRM|nr:hypothetical protein [Anaeromicrobium sediminis]PAB57935.1 hypothetical protein CCE28_17370 [Anaeromicrobium sediminis]
MGKDTLDKIYDTLKNIERLLENKKTYDFRFEESNTLEEELFKITTKVYYDEEKLKQKKGLRKKSSIRIYKNLMKEYMDFFSTRMENFQIEESDNYGMILFKKDNRYTGAVRILTDLGYYRKEAFYNLTKNLVNECLRYGINRRNIYIIVLSHHNGLDKEFTKKLIDKGIDNSQILKDENREILEAYEKKHIYNLNSYLKEPDKQVFFLGAHIHPNLVANSYFNNEELKITNYNWLSNPMEDIINELKRKN